MYSMVSVERASESFRAGGMFPPKRVKGLVVAGCLAAAIEWGA